MRGPKPQAAEVKSQKAALRSKHARRFDAPGVAAISMSGQPPKWLKKEGLRIWHRLAPRLQAAKLLADADAETFGRYCRNFARWLKMQRELDKDGETYESESQHGKLRRASPAFLISDRIERQLLAAEDRFGLNPAERQRIFVARAQTGVSGDLFSADKPAADRRPGDPAAQPAAAAEPIDSPVGLLN